VKNRAAWVVGGLAVAGAYAWGRLRQPYAEAPAAPAPQAAPERDPEAAPATAPEGPDPRADELRRRLEESRELVEERDAFEEPG
jgi:hypothetical protein